MLKWVQYKDERENIKTGDMFFTASNALFSHLIRIITRSKVSHVGVFIKIGKRVFTVECLEGKGCIMQLASVRFSKDSFVHSSHRTPPHDFIDRVLEDVGRIEYNLFGVILSPFFRTKSSQKFCSEWACKVLEIDKSAYVRGVYPADLVG